MVKCFHVLDGKLLLDFPKVKDQLNLFAAEITKEKPSASTCSRLHEHAEDIADFKYKNTDLVEGWLIENEEQGGQVNWKMRELKDCQADLKALALDMVLALTERSEAGIPDLLYTLQECLDFGVLFSALCGERMRNEAIPVKRSSFMAAGQVEFRSCVSFVSKLPHVAEIIEKENLLLDESFSDVIFWKLKTFLIEVVWGKKFEEFFSKCFKKTCGKKLESVAVPRSQVITRFEVDKEGFDLLVPPRVTLSDGSSSTYVLQEKQVIQMLYSNPTFYEAVGREFCIIYDIFFAKAGTEAIAESFYRVMEAQQKDGGQSQEVLTMWTKVDWCLPSVLQCEKALSAMAKLYIEGDKSLGLKKHFIPVYKDTRSDRDNSIVMERLIRTPARLPFLV